MCRHYYYFFSLLRLSVKTVRLCLTIAFFPPFFYFQEQASFFGIYVRFDSYNEATREGRLGCFGNIRRCQLIEL